MPAHIANVTFDGRLLDQGGDAGKKKGLQEEHSSGRVNKSLPSRHPKHEAPPLTPPHVAGISLAPLAEGDGDRRRVPAPQRGAGQAGRQQPESGLVLASKPLAGQQQQGAASKDGPQLLAEGRAVHADLDLRVNLYHEIYEADSLCGTPPALTVAAIRGHGKGPFGPLQAQPLSPSILTLCGDMNLRGEGGDVWESFSSLPDMRCSSQAST